MSRSIVARAAFRPAVLGLVMGGVVSATAAAVVLGSTAAAGREQVAVHAVLEATHLPHLLVVPGERVKLAFEVHCAQAGVEDPEQACDVVGSLFVRSGSAGAFLPTPLAAESASGLMQLVAVVPGTVATHSDVFEYYATIEAKETGDRLRLPAGAGTTYRAYVVPDAVDVDLAPRPLVSARRGSRVISASWGDRASDVGLEPGRSADPIGASSFDVDPSGAVVLLDEAHRRALRFAGAKREPESIPLSIDGRLADLAIGESGSMNVLESVAMDGRAPLVRRFDRIGRQVDVVETAERFPSQIRVGPDGPVVLEHPSHMWMPVADGDSPLAPPEQLRRGAVGRPLPSGAEVIGLRTGDELRLALLVGGRVHSSWRLTSAEPLAEVQLAEALGTRLVVVVRVYDDHSDEFRVLVLDRNGIVQQFSVEPADWAETAPLSRFRLSGSSLYRLGSNPSGAFVDRYDLEVR
jgi:hypothetical protein